MNPKTHTPAGDEKPDCVQVFVALGGGMQVFTQAPPPLPLHKPWPALMAIALKGDKVERGREINLSSFMAA